MSIIILIEILIAIGLLYFIQAWFRESLQKRKDLKKIRKDIDLLQSMKSEIEDND